MDFGVDALVTIPWDKIGVLLENITREPVNFGLLWCARGTYLFLDTIYVTVL